MGSEHLTDLADKVLNNDLINDVIFSFCTPATLLRLARTCRQVHASVQAYMRRTFNINRHLVRFFPDPIAFRSLQARTGTLIAGSSALQFFDRTFYPESDLDIYVGFDFRTEVGQWLLHTGYSFIPNSKQPADFLAASNHPQVLDQWEGEALYNYSDMPGVCTVFTFEKPSQSSPDAKLKVQVIVAQCAPMEVVLQFHSTCVINLITYEKAYSVYPRATFEERRSIICAPVCPRDELAITKYRNRGWRMQTAINDPPGVHGPKDNSFYPGTRWLEDGDTWIIPLNMDDVELPPRFSIQSREIPSDPASVSSWKHWYPPYGDMPVIEVETYGSKHLRFNYLIADKHFAKAAGETLTFFAQKPVRLAGGTMGMHPVNDPAALKGHIFYDHTLIEFCASELEAQRRASSKHRTQITTVSSISLSSYVCEDMPIPKKRADT